MTHIVLSKKQCLPCRQVIKIIKANNLDWDIMYHYEDPTFYEVLGIKSAPSLVKVMSERNFIKEYKIVAVGLDEIIEYSSNYVFSTNEEEE